MLDEILKNERKKLYCLDWDQDGDLINLFGDRSDNSYQRLDLIVAPCNYLNTEFGNEDDKIAEGCIADLEKQQDYVGSVMMQLLVTDEIFIQDKYGKETIDRRSMFHSM